MKIRILISAAALGLAAIPLGVPAAQAASPDVNEHYSFEDSGNFRDCGLRLHEDVTGGGHFMLFAIEESEGQAWLGHDNFWYRQVFTNRDTGEWFEVTGRGLFKEMTGTQVEGNIWEFTAIEAGQPFVVRDAQGNVILRDRGLVGYRALFDLLGDGQVGGELIEEEITHVAGPHPGLDADFCDVVVDLIG